MNPLATSFTRTLKRDALEHRVTRDVETLVVHFTQEEAEIYHSFIDVNLLRHELRGVSPKAFGLIVNGLERIAASSIPALTTNIKRYMKGFEKELEDSGGDEVDLSSSDKAGMKRFLQLHYDGLLERIDKLHGKDSKFETFLRLLKIIRKAMPENPRVIVFSFYVGTLKYLRRKLKEHGYGTGIIYGDTPNETPAEQIDEDGYRIYGRYDTIKAFEKGDIDILLASEVGGEGLDFQFCSALINYVLPYNPMRVEQRIGRIDRMGQKADKIIVGNLCISGTIDMVINQVLLRRISEAEDLVGDLEPIITGNIVDINCLIITKGFNENELAKRTHEIELQIEEAKATREEFDKRRYELVNDSGFREEFEQDISKSRINPFESLRFTEVFLKGINGCWSKRIDDTTLDIHITRTIKELIKSYYNHVRLGAGGQELKRIYESEGDVRLNFNGNSAYERSEDVFVKPSGAWIHFLVAYIKDIDNLQDGSAFEATIKHNDFAEPGRHYIFIYEYQLVGFHDLKSTHYVSVYSKTLEPKICEGSQWETLLSNINNEYNRESVDINEYYEIRAIADTKAEDDLSRIRSELIGSNEIKINSRIEALRKNSKIRIEGYQKDLIGAAEKDSQRIKRKISRDIEKTNKSIALLEKRKMISSSTAFQGVMILNAT